MDNRKPAPAVLLDCDVCLREIPRSAALTAEGGDYVGAFCGLDCYQTLLREPAPATPAVCREEPCAG